MSYASPTLKKNGVIRQMVDFVMIEKKTLRNI